jgi:hypothetical protein
LGIAGAFSSQGVQTLTPPQKISFCDLAMHSEKYDGHVVLTEAVAGNSFHAVVLFDPLCSEMRSEAGMSLSAQPKMAPQHKKDKLDIEYRKALDEDSSVRIIFVGTVESLSQSAYGPEGQRFQINIERLIAVHRISAAERDALGIGEGVQISK